ncbi:hypothetical protein TWF718_002215 [Orbilia javanica]|uniref:Uncharacterized protein n=1 Tax=Orbilia javanica TaxID=47235 RepID=A0AAN8MQB9_9PEZI
MISPKPHANLTTSSSQQICLEGSQPASASPQLIDAVSFRLTPAAVMEETKEGIGPWAGLPASKDPASPHYLYHPEHERLSSIVPSAITSPSITPALPSFIAYWTGMYNMYGVRGRDSVFVVAMRRRAEIIPRPFTQTEHAVLARYSQNMQNGAEYFGLLGLFGGAYWSTRTEYWPMEKTLRTMFLPSQGQPGATGSSPPSGFVYPNGWGQNEAGGTTGAAAASSTPNSAASPTPTAGPTASPTTAQTAANTQASSTGIPPSRLSGKFNPKALPIDITQITESYLKGPRVQNTSPLLSYGFPLSFQRKLFMMPVPPDFMVRFAMWQVARLKAIPVEQRGSRMYEMYYDLAEESIIRARSWGLTMDKTRTAAKFVYESELKKHREGPETEVRKEIEALAKEIEAFEKQMVEAKKVWQDKMSTLEREAEAEIVARRRPGAVASATIDGKWMGAKQEWKDLADAATKETEADQKRRPDPARPASFQTHGASGPDIAKRTIVVQFSPVKSVMGAVRAGTWAFFGKYVVGTLGLIWLTSGSRRKEIADERLQEYNYDRMEYAKLRMKEAAARRGLPGPPPQTQQEPRYGDDSESGSRQPERFEPVDSQSLGGVQSESIDWGDLVKDDTPVITRQQTNTSVLPPGKPGESAWDRARRAREGPQGPAMEEDRWAPQGQQDTAPKTDDMANMSRWERIRQQASEGYGSERRIPGESRDGGDSAGSFGGFGRKQQGQDRQKTREELQKEFDAQVEKDRRGEEGSWK